MLIIRCRIDDSIFKAFRFAGDLVVMRVGCTRKVKTGSDRRPPDLLDVYYPAIPARSRLKGTPFRKRAKR